MKINFIVPNIAKLGGTRIALEYATRLSERGHDVKVFQQLLPYNYDEIFGLCNFARSFFGRIKELIRQRSILKDIGFENVEVSILPFISNFFLRNADFSIAINWVTARNLNKLNAEKGKRIYFIQAFETFISSERLISSVFRLPLLKIVVSNYLKELLSEKYGIDSFCVLNGVDFKTFYNTSKVYHKDRVNIVFIEHDLKSKAVGKILEVIKILKSKYPNLNIISFGLRDFNGLPEYVKFYKSPDDNMIREIYSASDIFVGASESEGFYLSPAEAMACKCAVVVSKVGAVTEYSRHLESAMHFEPGDSEKMLRNICYLIDNPIELKRISENGYDEIRDKLNWNNSINEFETHLKSLL